MSQGSLLLVAYQCGPGMGSVSQIGWEWYSRLRHSHRVTLVTHVRNRAAIEGATATGHSEIIYIDTEWFAGPLYRLAKFLFPVSEHSVFMVSSLDYFLFDFQAWRQLKALQARGNTWQLVHRVTPVSLAAPTWLGRLGVPLVVGPVNCGLANPKGFDAIMRQEFSWLVGLREIGRYFDALIGSTKSIARILTATRATLEWVAPHHRVRCRMMLENGVNPEAFTATPWPAAPTRRQALNVLFVGRLVPFKGLDMLIQAVAALRAEGWPVVLNILGAGPMQESWQMMGANLGVDDIVKFHGNQPAALVARHLAANHVLCLPSVRESGGAVLLEAMACARPVIALGHGGPAEIVTAKVGALITPESPRQVVAELINVLRGVYLDPAAWRQRGVAGRQDLELNYSWSAKLKAAGCLYQELIAEGVSHA